jgi:hypothetical protein
MKQILVTITLLLAAGAAACAKNETTTPSSTTTTSVAATTTTTAATTSTTSIAAPTQFTLSGTIIDQTTSRPVPLADIEVIEGANLGRTFRADASGNYSALLNPGTFTIRVRAFGYPSTDFRGIVITNANVRFDIGLIPTPPSTTTTTTPTLHADFFWTPDPCTITGATATVDCTVDGSASTGSITTYAWSYKSKTVANNARFMLVLACSDLGSSTSDTVNVTLTVTDTGGGTDTVTKGVPINKVSGACP